MKKIYMFILIFWGLQSSSNPSFAQHEIKLCTSGQQYGVAHLDHLWISTEASENDVFVEIPLEGPTDYDFGQVAWSNSAIGTRSWAEFGSESSGDFLPLSGCLTYSDITASGTVFIKIRYSKHSASSVPIRILVNGKEKASFTPIDQHSWHDFTSSSWISVEFPTDELQPIIADLSLRTKGQQYGVAHLDHIWLSTSADDNGIYEDFSLENPSQYNVGQLTFNSNALGGRAWAEFGSISTPPWAAKPGHVTYQEIEGIGTVYVKIQYSKHSPSTTPIEIYLDDVKKNDFTPVNQNSWDRFVKTDWIPIEFTTNVSASAGYWAISSFGCDAGHNNTFTLQRNGAPVCGSSNCPGSPAISPNGCWNPSPITSTYNDGGTNWTTEENGSLRLGHVKDGQVYGKTFLRVTSPKTITPEFIHNKGGLWLNNRQIERSSTLNLEAGWNKLEFTSYNQNSSGSLELLLDFRKEVDEMTATPPPNIEVALSEEKGETATSVDENAYLPLDFTLSQNHPNPFAHSTTISFSLPQSTPVKLIVYDVLGRVVDTLVDGILDAGHHQVTFQAKKFPNGLYTYRLTTPEISATKSMILAN